MIFVSRLVYFCLCFGVIFSYDNFLVNDSINCTDDPFCTRKNNELKFYCSDINGNFDISLCKIQNSDPTRPCVARNQVSPGAELIYIFCTAMQLTTISVVVFATKKINEIIKNEMNKLNFCQGSPTPSTL